MKEIASNKMVLCLGMNVIEKDQTSSIHGIMLEMNSTIGSLSVRSCLVKQQSFKHLNSFNNPSIIKNFSNLQKNVKKVFALKFIAFLSICHTQIILASTRMKMENSIK